MALFPVRGIGEESQNPCRFEKERNAVKTVGKALFVAGLLLLCAGAVRAAEFEADLVIEGPMGAMTGKIYVKGDRQRQDMTGEMGRTGVITSGEEGATLILLHDQQAYMEMSEGQSPLTGMNAPDLDGLTAEGEGAKGQKMEKLGNETVEGYLCEKIRLVDEGSPESSTLIWFSHELGFLLKAVHQSPEGTSTVQYRNIVAGAVADSVFDVPSDYRRLDVGAF